MKQKTNETASTREQAIAYFNSLPSVDQQMLTDRYFNECHRQSLTGREIEEIWRKECNQIENEVFKSNQKQLNVTNCGNKNCQSGIINGITPRICKKCNPINQKQFIDKPQSKEIRKSLDIKYNQKYGVSISINIL